LESVNHVSEKECPALKTLNLNTGICKCTYNDPVEVLCIKKLLTITTLGET